MNAMFINACEYDMKSTHLMNKTLLLLSLHIYTDKKFSDTANTINIRWRQERDSLLLPEMFEGWTLLIPIYC